MFYGKVFKFVGLKTFNCFVNISSIHKFWASNGVILYLMYNKYVGLSIRSPGIILYGKIFIIIPLRHILCLNTVHFYYNNTNNQ